MVKLSRAPLYEQAYEAILRMILDGELEPGQRVTEGALAESLGVSPTPVREAMRKLEHDGLLESKGSTMRVLALTSQDIEQLYVAREALEVTAIKAAITQLDTSDFEALHMLLTRAEAAATQRDFLVLVRANTAFHDRLLEASGNPWLKSAIGFVRRPLLFARIQITLDEDELNRLLHDHREILKTLEAGDPEQAVTVMRRHMRADCDYMCTALEKLS